MKEIAALAGVSKATVSRVIHSPHMVKAETRQKIERLMAEHSYVYDVHAAEFSRRKASVIGLIVPTLRGSIYAEQIMGMQARIGETSYALLIGHNNYDVEIETALLNLFLQRRLAGVILTGIKPESIDFVRSAQVDGMPCVVTWETVDDPSISYVGFDNHRAAFTATEYLLRLGHRRIGLIMGPVSTVTRVKQRLAGYRAALEGAGVTFDSGLVIEKQPTLSDGNQAMSRLLGLSRRPTAVFAASDLLALGAMKAATDAGLEVPKDLSIVGFDDVDMAAYSMPALSTVRVPAYEMGDLAVASLLDMIENGSSGAHRYCLDTELVVRGSCGPPPVNVQISV